MANNIRIQDALEMTYYDKFKQTAREQGIFIDLFELSMDMPSVNSGTYLVISPSSKYLSELRNRPGILSDLIEDQKLMGEGGFNPNYRVIDCAPLMKDAGGDNFDAVMSVFRAIQDEASLVNCFGEFGFKDLPMFIHSNAIYEMVRLRERSVDIRLPEKVRKRYKNDYKKFVGSMYQRYAEISEERIKPISPIQKVNKDFFVMHQMDTTQEVINKPFREFFELKIKKYPKFMYFIDEDKPSLHLKDLSKLYKGSGVNIWKDEKEITEWNITIPKCYEHIFYSLMLEWNMRTYHGQTENIFQVGGPDKIATVRVNDKDMWNWDSLCKANNVPYYINHGDLERLNFHGTQSIKVAINKDDIPMVKAIMYRLVNEMSDVRVINPEEAKRNIEEQKKIDSNRPIMTNNKVFDLYDGLGR